MEDHTIQHLLVLMLENRSFDHMLGYLNYPPGAQFEGIRDREHELGNPLPNGDVLFPGPNASYTVHPGPGHSHDDVLQQLLGQNDRSQPYRLTNNGFAANYDGQYSPGHGDVALQCFTPERLPILSSLAQEFAVCDHWFCSVPGATWPNRNFCHAGTSDGQVNIVVRSYRNKTIFEQLSESKRDWAVYYGGFPPQSLAFSRLWLPWEHNWLQRFKPIAQLYRAIRFDRLPHYAFIEPDMIGQVSDSQHPGMGGEQDFRAAEHLIWRIYTTLRANPAVFEKTLFVVTYDEHGGFVDHVPPPQGAQWSVARAFTSADGSYTFRFDLLGPRVPTILISPWVDAGTVDHTVYDHASIPATVRRLFEVTAGPLDGRDAQANTFEHTLSRATPRAGLPDLPEPIVNQAERHMVIEPDLRNSLVQVLTGTVWSELRSRAQTLTLLDAPGPITVADLPPVPQQAHADIMEDIAPRLSPEAQAILAQPPLPDPALNGADFALPGVTAVINFLNRKAEQLASNLELVDDLMLFVDRVLRRWVEGHRIILRTAGGESIEQPDQADLAAALDELGTLAARQGRVPYFWLADHQDRWLTVEPGGRVTFDEQAAGPVPTLHDQSRDRTLELLALFCAGDISRLRAAFR